MSNSRPDDAPPGSIPRRLREAEEFFMRKGPVFSTLERLAARLDQEKIPYAVAGAMALNLHGFERMTRDVDVLMTAEALEEFKQRCVGRGYVPAFSGAHHTFRDTDSNTPIEVLVSGGYPGDGKPKAVAFPDPRTASVVMSDIHVLTLEKLIELKLASGLSAPHRLRDLADVQDLIRALHLPLDVRDRLDASVRAEFERLWHMARTAGDEES